MHRKHIARVLTPTEFEELRTLIEELDLVPLSVYPSELRPIALDYYKSLENVDRPFENEIERVSINIYLSNRKRKKHVISDDDLLLFDPCV